MGQESVARGGKPEWPDARGREVQAAWRRYVRPLLGQFSQRLDLRLDLPLVRTLRDGVEALIWLRLRPQALWLYV